MPEKRFFTEKELRRFKIWLIDKGLSINQFAKRCGVAHQYISDTIHGKYNVTPRIIETFKKGGFEIKEVK